MKPLNPPSSAKRAESISYHITSTTLGQLLVAQGERGVCAILFGDDAATLHSDLVATFPQAAFTADAKALEPTTAQLKRLLEDPSLSIEGPLDLRGTAFQQRVWAALREIPPGERWSYKQLAQALDMPQGARAVATACAANRLAVVIPCHRVVGADGALTGYRWGIERKRWLLAKEAR